MKWHRTSTDWRRNWRPTPRYRELFDAAYGGISAAAIARALASFERTLISANSRYDQFLRGEITLDPQEELGRKLFMAHPDVKVSLRGANCIDCHSQFLTGGFSARLDGFSNNGLDDEEHLQPGLQAVTGNPAHRGMFKVPYVEEHRAHRALHARRPFQDPRGGAAITTTAASKRAAH